MIRPVFGLHEYGAMLLALEALEDLPEPPL